MRREFSFVSGGESARSTEDGPVVRLCDDLQDSTIIALAKTAKPLHGFHPLDELKWIHHAKPMTHNSKH